MKQLYRCDFCDQIGTAEEIEKHEAECIHNYTKRSCLTCKHRKIESLNSYGCALNKRIPGGKYIEQCSSYEQGEPTDNDIFNQIFGNLFGGL